MKNATRYFINLAAAVLLVITSATIAAAQASDTCAGEGATIGNTCTPLTNGISGNLGNTAFGANALSSDIESTRPILGFNNTAIGASALQLNTIGIFNTATGDFALESNTEGMENTAAGVAALHANTLGNGNTATGRSALLSNTIGSYNTACGGALAGNTTGSFNIGVGFVAGENLTTGDNNIDIGNAGVAAEADTIRIGTQGTQTATFIAGIFGGSTMKKGCDVMADSAGLLGCAKSSARYKRDIRDMGDASDKLMKLRPVTFQYKEDADAIRQYGLIAEEVEKVYPELVIEGDDGRPETVEYQALPAMLLNEVQKQVRADHQMARQLVHKDAQIAAMQRQIAALQKRESEIDTMAERLGALERQARTSRPERMAAAAQ